MEETKHCPYCGEEILAVAKKCKYCGEWLEAEKQEPVPPQKINCPVCGEEIDESTEICPYCHEHVETPIEKPVETPKETPKEEPVEMPKVAVTPAKSEPVTVLRTKSKLAFNGIFVTYFFDTLRKHYADFKGAASRKSYWYFVLCSMITMFGISSIGLLFGMGTFFCLYLIANLVLFLPTLAIVVRRLHDIGKSGWWMFIAMIPIVGPIWLLILLIKKGETTAPDTKWSMFDALYIGVIALVFIVGIVSSVVCGEKCYVYEDSEWVGNKDYSLFFAVGTTDKRDIEPSDYIDHYGAQVIVASDEPDGKVHTVLSSKDIAARNPKVGTDLFYTIFPSTINPNLVYFNYWMDGMEFPLCGKVNCETGEFDLFDGSIIGMISDGRFDECYVKVESGKTEGVRIYHQSDVGQNASPVSAFNIAQYWRGHSNDELIISNKFAERVIEWLEGME